MTAKSTTEAFTHREECDTRKVRPIAKVPADDHKKIDDMSYELYIPPKWTGKHAKTGRFLKGHVPYNKGKKWDEFMSKRGQRRAAKGWKNLDKYRPTTRPDNAGRCRKQVIAVMDDGTWHWFPYMGAAAEWVGRRRDDVRRCCKMNQSRTRLRDTHGRLTDKVNTDHKYKGVRFYYESDDIWTDKIRE